MEKLSPFELKNFLIKIANKDGNMLNTGRGNPNFFNAFVREAFAELQLVILKLHKTDILPIYPLENEYSYNNELVKQINKIKDNKIKSFLLKYISFFKKNNKYLYDVVLSTLGTFYPTPPRIQIHLEKICEKYMYEKITKKKGFEYFACEGAAAGILYVFNSLYYNKIIKKNDKIAIITPIFSPYLELPKLQQYDLKTVELKGNPEKMYSLDKKEMDKLKNKKIKVLFLVNPANPGAFSLPKSNITYIANIIRKYNKDLVIVSDTVYSPFVKTFNSFIKEIPENTILIQSLSKYFGVTGWRLGLVMINKKNIMNKLIENNKSLGKRYTLISTTPNKLSFMERLVADSRQVAEGHVAGLSTPQQVLLGMFFIYDLTHPKYKTEVYSILEKRIKLLYSNIGIKLTISPLSTDYYTLFNIPKITEELYGTKAKDKLLKKDYYKFIFHLAIKYKIVVLPGQGFGTNKWVIRISLANLATDKYSIIGKSIKNAIEDFTK